MFDDPVTRKLAALCEAERKGVRSWIFSDEPNGSHWHFKTDQRILFCVIPIFMQAIS